MFTLLPHGKWQDSISSGAFLKFKKSVKVLICTLKAKNIPFVHVFEFYLVPCILTAGVFNKDSPLPTVFPLKSDMKVVTLTSQ
jgi:hypothetical protein